MVWTSITPRAKRLQSNLRDILSSVLVFDLRLNWEDLPDRELVRLLAEVSRSTPRRMRLTEQPVYDTEAFVISAIWTPLFSGARYLLGHGLKEAGRRGLLPVDADSFRVEIDQALEAGTFEIAEGAPHTLVSFWAGSRWPGVLDDDEVFWGAVWWLRSAKQFLNARWTFHINGDEYEVPAVASTEVIAESLAEQLAASGSPLNVRASDGQIVLTMGSPSEAAVQGSYIDEAPRHRPIGASLARRLDRRSR